MCKILLVVLLYPASLLARELADIESLPITRVAENVYSAIGETGPPTYENAGRLFQTMEMEAFC